MTSAVTDDALYSIPPEVANRFVEKCEERGDEPRAALERLMLDYTREDDVESKIVEIHETIVDDDAPVLIDEEGQGSSVELLENYDPQEDGRLTKETLKQLTDSHGGIAINPAHVADESLPQDTRVKQELIKAIARYEYSVVKKQHVNDIADTLLDIGPQYRKRQYVEPVWSELIALATTNVTATFVSDVESALEWMDEQLDESGARAETDIYWLASELHHSDEEVPMEALNERLHPISMDVEGLHSPK
jgi:hypothetical protein